jgi:hypothetical protein
MMDAEQPWIHFTASTPNASNTSANGIDELQVDFAIYPNPTASVLHFEKSFHAVVWNAMGVQVMASNQCSEISVSHLPNGMYFLQTENGKWPFIKCD